MGNKEINTLGGIHHPRDQPFCFWAFPPPAYLMDQAGQQRQHFLLTASLPTLIVWHQLKATYKWS